MRRKSKKEYYLDIAKVVSSRSTCLKRHYGVVIVKNDEIIATGYNGSPRGKENCCDIHESCPRLNEPNNSGLYDNCQSIHAEQNAMISASRKDMLDSVMYLYGEEGIMDSEDNNIVTGWVDIEKPEPCPICKRMLNNAGIKRIVTKGGVICIQ